MSTTTSQAPNPEAARHERDKWVIAQHDGGKGKKVKEIADACGITTQAVYLILAKAKRPPAKKRK